MSHMFMNFFNNLWGIEYGGISTTKLLRRLEDCKIPADKKAIADLLELLSDKLDYESKKVADEIIAFKGMFVVYKCLKEMKNDGNIAYLCIQIFASLTNYPTLMTDLVEMGALKFLQEIIPLHATNKFLAMFIPDVIQVVRDAGVKQALVEIQNESTSLIFCTHCQALAQRQKDKEMGVDVGQRLNNPNTFVVSIVPTGCARINKITYFMKEYEFVESVQIEGLNAIMVFARSGDAMESIQETCAIEVAATAANNFPANDKVRWFALIKNLLS